MEKLLNLKAKIIEEFNSLGIEGLHLTDLNLLNGSYINLEYTLPNGQKVKLLEDDKMYLGNQVEIDGKERCMGMVFMSYYRKDQISDKNHPFALFKYYSTILTNVPIFST